MTKGRFWRHVKRGSHYEVVGTAELQSSGGPVKEGRSLVVYLSQDGKLYARPLDEFLDGRFESISVLSKIVSDRV